MTVEWEKKLNDLYDVAQYGLKKDESKKAIAFLREKQQSNLEILEHLEVEKFGPTERVRFKEDQIERIKNYIRAQL